MKVVTYNVNGLRPRISQHGTLQKLLDSFDADVICFQETKLRRPELTSDLAMAEGYESFFSCTRTSERGRSGYSGVATFFRVRSAFSSSEAALPVAAEEGFTGVFAASSTVAAGLEEFEVDELRSVDGEGRCVVTDHNHFVLFNVYGPRAVSDDTERIEFKMKFFKIMQKRWESLLSEGRTVLVVGDLNIAPTSLDRCEAGPDFENNEFRRWFRSMLVENGGAFVDVFRSKHPDRRDAYTCWSQSTGAEEFNYGSRIDHILCAGSFLHSEPDHDHNFITCHVNECDILTEYKRWKPGNSLRWKGGNRLKLEGSDHAPVYASFLQIPDVPPHNTPPLSARYIPMIYGIQQTLVSTLMKRQITTKIKFDEESCLSASRKTTLESCSEKAKTLLDRCNGNPCSSSKGDEVPEIISVKETDDYGVKKKAKRNQWSQLSLKSFFQKINQAGNITEPSQKSTDPASGDDLIKNLDQSDTPPNMCELTSSESTNNRDEPFTGSAEKNSVALQEWQRIHNMMQNSIPLCKGHKKPCVARVVKKQGSNAGRCFYVCSRAEGPSTNPEANCGYFKWASSKSRGK